MNINYLKSQEYKNLTQDLKLTQFLNEFKIIFTQIHDHLRHIISLVDDDDLRQLGVKSKELLSDAEAILIDEGKYYKYFRLTFENDMAIIVCVPWLRDVNRNLDFSFNPEEVSPLEVRSFAFKYLKLKLKHIMVSEIELTDHEFDELASLYSKVSSELALDYPRILPSAN